MKQCWTVKLINKYLREEINRRAKLVVGTCFATSWDAGYSAALIDLQKMLKDKGLEK